MKLNSYATHSYFSSYIVIKIKLFKWFALHICTPITEQIYCKRCCGSSFNLTPFPSECKVHTVHNTVRTREKTKVRRRAIHELLILSGRCRMNSEVTIFIVIL